MKKFYRRHIRELYFNSYYYHYMSGLGEEDDLELFRELNEEYQEELMSYIRGAPARMLHYMRMDRDGTLDNIMHKALTEARHRTRGITRRMVRTYTVGIKIVSEHERDYLRQRDGW